MIKNMFNAKEYNKKYNKEHFKTIKLNKHRYYLKNKKRISQRDKSYYKLNKNKILKRFKKYYLKHKKEILQRSKLRYLFKREQVLKYYKVNKKKLNKLRAKNLKIQRKNNINFYILSNLRTRLSMALKGNPKLSTTMKLVGCSIEQLKQHLESQFKSGMSWDNYGKWHIDHIIPCAKFDLSKPSEQRKCFHYTNLQPLWAEENLRKQDK